MAKLKRSLRTSVLRVPGVKYNLTSHGKCLWAVRARYMPYRFAFHTVSQQQTAISYMSKLR